MRNQTFSSKSLLSMLLAAAMSTMFFSVVHAEDDSAAINAESVTTYEARVLTGKHRSQVLPSKPGSVEVLGPNPLLSFLPAGAKADYIGWQHRLRLAADARRRDQVAAAAQSGGGLTSLISTSEAEPVGVKGLNDAPGDAEFIAGFGTGGGKDTSADISGNLRTSPAPRSISANAEDDGQISLAAITGLLDNDGIIADVLTGGGGATQTIGDGPFGFASGTSLFPTPINDHGDTGSALATGLVPSSIVFVDAEIGDGPFAATSGDFDFYAFDITDTEILTIEVARRDSDTTFRPIVAIYQPNGDLALTFDDSFIPGFVGVQVALTSFGGTDTWYVAVGGNLEFDGDPSNEFLGVSSDSSTGPGVGSLGLYELILSQPPSGDFDFYSFTGVTGDDITIEVDTDLHGAVLDPIVALYDSTGLQLAFNDDDPGALTFDSFLSFTVPSDDTFYVVVGGFSLFPTTPASFPDDPFVSSSGPGAGSEGDYDLIVTRNQRDLDFFSFDLKAGDIIAANLFGSAEILGLFDNADNLAMGSGSDSSGIYPASSALPSGGNASLASVVATDGLYKVLVVGSSGDYTLELRAFRAPQEATGITQRIFIDFDGATVDTSIFGAAGAQPRALSALSTFLVDWGLSPGDQDAVIDAILATVESKLSQDIAGNGLNPTFDIEIFNSRDDLDDFGDADVSRVVVGGTITESGVSTIGIAQSIDVGNFDQSEDSIVLLDLLSGTVPGDPNSLNNIALDAGSSIIDLIGVAVGNIIAHEAGHFFANFHTNNLNTVFDIMDSGGNLPGTIGVGADGIFGTPDDLDVFMDFDEFSPFEGFVGFEDTRNAMAFGLTTGPLEAVDLAGVDDTSGDGVADVASLIDDGSGAPEVQMVSGANGQSLGTLQFLNALWVELAIESLSDGNGDGTADDPAVALLARNPANSDSMVQTRLVGTGASLGNIKFFNPAWTALDIAVINDLNFDGNTNDPAIAVLALNPVTSKIGVQTRLLSDGSVVSTRYFLNPAWTPIALDIVERPGLTPLIGVLAVNPVTDKTLVQSRQLSDGATQANTVFLNTDWRGRDLTVEYDLNADATADDPAWLVLATNAVTDKNAVQSRAVTGGAVAKNIFYLNPFWTATHVDTVGDTSGNGLDETGVTARQESNGKDVIQLQDYGTATLTRNIFP